MLPAGVVTAVACGWLAHTIGRWNIFVWLAAFPIWIGVSWLFWEGPRWLMAFTNRFRRCPNCGATDWSHPKYNGFGL